MLMIGGKVPKQNVINLTNLKKAVDYSHAYSHASVNQQFGFKILLLAIGQRPLKFPGDPIG